MALMNEHWDHIEKLEHKNYGGLPVEDLKTNDKEIKSETKNALDSLIVLEGILDGRENDILKVEESYFTQITVLDAIREIKKQIEEGADPNNPLYGFAVKMIIQMTNPRAYDILYGKLDSISKKYYETGDLDIESIVEVLIKDMILNGENS
jgi:hypothetical protein